MQAFLCNIHKALFFAVTSHLVPFPRERGGCVFAENQLLTFISVQPLVPTQAPAELGQTEKGNPSPAPGLQRIAQDCNQRDFHTRTPNRTGHEGWRGLLESGLHPQPMGPAGTSPRGTRSPRQHGVEGAAARPCLGRLGPAARCQAGPKEACVGSRSGLACTFGRLRHEEGGHPGSARAAGGGEAWGGFAGAVGIALRGP